MDEENDWGWWNEGKGERKDKVEEDSVDEEKDDDGRDNLVMIVLRYYIVE